MAMSYHSFSLPGQSRLIRATIALLVCQILGSCTDPPSTVEAVRAVGELRIATLNTGTIYFEGPDGYSGFEHDLTRAFAQYLGVEARYVVASSHSELSELVRHNKAHLAAALMPIGNDQVKGLSFGPSYATLRQTVIYRRSDRRPENIEDLRGKSIAAPGGRGARAVLEQELPASAGVQWTIRDDLSIDDLLDLVDRNEIDFAVVPAGEFAAARLYYPETREAFAIGAPQAVGWLYHRGPENSLWTAQLEFLNAVRGNGELKILRDRYFGHIEKFDYAEARAFLRHYDERLPKYRDAFIDTGAEYAVDWLLLAAMSYQESHWREDAKSPTGVRGLMMLTKRTARALSVDRLDPIESIRGGTEYLADLRSRLPERIAEPDKSWFALAAYNVGLGHLEDARVFTEQAGLNPDRWAEVRQYLPKLSNKSWANKARHGYARGYQAVHFVQNIRRYHDVLRWLESAPDDEPEAARPPSTLFAPILPRGPGV
ncbi:MAG: membrane-bound lytic murein transglycosylase MltF [Gammaproteobacteria bacterium]|nr:membrane-bound lytic murein transglycosylase MltF [Gammaproteobacteria bacterium]